MMNRKFYGPVRKQRGAALVVGLLLLVILTLLAISGMNTASTELVMAGNEQYRLRAFQAANSGLEVAVSDLYKVPQTGVKTTTPKTDVTDSAPDTMTMTSQYKGEDLNVPGYSAGKYAGYHYEISSTGESARNAQSVETVGAFVIQKK